MGEPQVLHVDFARVDLNEKVELTISIELKGEPKGEKDGGVLQQILNELEIECLVTDIPDNITVDVSHMEKDSVLHLSDVKLPQGVTTKVDLELIVCKVEEIAEQPEEAAAAEPNLFKGVGFRLVRERKPEAEDDLEGALIEAREDIAALGMMENLQLFFDAEATKVSDEWLAKYRDQIKRLPDDRQEVYRQISALSREPQDVDLARPVSWMEATVAREKDGTETKVPTYTNHLLCDDHGVYPVELRDWEKSVLKAETQRDSFKFWYRNPDRPTQDSLGIAYVEDDDTKIVRPDFLFFVELPDGAVAVDIVDPHGFHLADALPKLQGLARYAETHSQIYRRIEAVAEAGGKLRVLDLTRADVRHALTDAPNAKSLYESALAGDYG